MQLHVARLCLDCQEVHDSQTCPICSSESFAYISRWIPAPERRAAPRAAEPAPQAEMYRQLLASSGKGRRPKASTHDEIVKDDSGRPLFRIRQLRSSIAVMLPVEHVPAQTLDAIRSTLSNLLSVAPVEVRVEEFRKPASEIRVVPPAAQPGRVISRISKVGAARNASA